MGQNVLTDESFAGGALLLLGLHPLVRLGDAAQGVVALLSLFLRDNVCVCVNVCVCMCVCFCVPLNYDL